MSRPIEIDKSDINRYFYIHVKNIAGDFHSIGKLISIETNLGGTSYIEYIDSITHKNYTILKVAFERKAVRLAFDHDFLMKQIS